MIIHAHSCQELDELILCGSGWPYFQYQTLGGSPSLDVFPSDFLAPDATVLGISVPFETSSLPGCIPHDTLEPFPCTDENVSLHFADSQLYGSSQDSGRTTIVSSPTPGSLYGIGSAINDDQPTVDNSSVSVPLQNASASMQGRDDIAQIGATICSLVADHLKRLSDLSTTRETTTPVLATKEPHSAPDNGISRRIRFDSQGHRASHRSSKTQKVEKDGIKHANDRFRR